MAKTDRPEKGSSNACFVIMPISDCDGYDKGHFGRVYEDVFKKAIIDAGFVPLRADEVKQTNMIHLDILQKLLESPMAVCDLSSRNPNVLFELGLRQAFDRPTVLVKDNLTENMFDIAPLRFTDYRRDLKYREVIEDQRAIKEAILATKAATEEGKGINSLVNLLSLASPARLKEVSPDDNVVQTLELMRFEMSEMRSELRRSNVRQSPEMQADDRRASSVIDNLDRDMMEIEGMIAGQAPLSLLQEYVERLDFRLMEVSQSASPKSYLASSAEKRRRRLREIWLLYRERYTKADSPLPNKN